MTPCPDRAELESYCAATLPPDRYAAVETHLADCASCLEVLDRLSREALQGLPLEVLGASVSPSPPAVPGYELLGVLGEGGMGIVYRARHRELDRVVALKMIKPGSLVGTEVVARFRTEAEAVARLQHPNVVQIFEVGEWGGQPYFTLEYCAGGSLDRKLAGTPLPPWDAARLVEMLARAMAVAHAQNIIHRDLKPHNVLLAADGSPKITDFGLARKLDEAGLSLSGEIIGTPSYMAPEQARGDLKAVGPPADVYAVGAVLYELLTGRPPFKAATKLETVMQVLADEPVPPRRLQPKTPRDLETICLKCLAKEPAKRYAAAQALADDLQRFRMGEPIVARPVGQVQRLVKWARRRPAVAALSGALVAAVVLGFALVTWKWLEELEARAQAEIREREATEARDNEKTARKKAAKAAEAEGKAKTEAQRAAEQERKARALAEKRLRQVETGNEILVSIFRDVDPRAEQKGGDPLQVQLGKYLDQAAKLLDAETVGDRLAVARLQAQLGVAYLGLGYPKRAIPLFSKALQGLEGEFGPDTLPTLGVMNNLGRAYLDAGQLAEALPLLERTLELSKAKQREEHPATLTSMNNLAMAYRAVGKSKMALDLDLKTLALREKVLGPDHPDTLTSMNNLAASYRADGKPESALPLLEKVHERTEAKRGPKDYYTLMSMNNLAVGYLETKKPHLALPLLEKVLDLAKERLAHDHPYTLTCMNSLVGAYRDTKQLDKAVPLMERTLELRKARQGSEHPDTLNSMYNLGSAYMATGKHEAAIRLLTEAVPLLKAKLSVDNAYTLRTMSQLAGAYLAVDEVDLALPLYEEVLQKGKSRLGPNHQDTLRSINNLIGAYQTAGKLDLTIAQKEQRLERIKANLGPSHLFTLSCMNTLAMAYWAAGQRERALPLFGETLQLLKANLGTENPNTHACMDNLAFAYEQTGAFAKAEPLRQELLAAYRKKPRPDRAQIADAQVKLGSTQLHQQKFADAEATLRQGYAQFLKLQPRGWNTFNTQSLLGAALLGQKKYADAEPLLLDGYHGMKARAAQIPAAARSRLVEAAERLVALYDAWDRPEAATQWRKIVKAERAALMPNKP